MSDADAPRLPPGWREHSARAFTRRSLARPGVGLFAHGSAKSVIFVWLWGGPSHLDTWDPKPDAPLEFRGPFSPIATSVPGIRICELFPQLARQADTFTILRSLHTGSNDHGVAGTIGLTGSAAGGVGL